jgi:hypothetical protein
MKTSVTLKGGPLDKEEVEIEMKELNEYPPIVEVAKLPNPSPVLAKRNCPAEVEPFSRYIYKHEGNGSYLYAEN